MYSKLDMMLFGLWPKFDFPSIPKIVYINIRTKYKAPVLISHKIKQPGPLKRGQRFEKQKKRKLL